MSIKALHADLNVQGTIRENNAYLSEKYATKNSLNELSQQMLKAPESSQSPAFTVQSFLSSTRAMRLFGLPADQIIIEQSTDGGTTWVDAQYGDAIKTSLFNQSRSYTPVIPLKNGVKSCDCMLRITITAMKYNVPENTPETDKYNYWNAEHVRLTERYCTLDFGYFWINANADAMYIEHQHALAQDPNTWITDGVLSNAWGWSGGNYIKFSGRTFGGSVGQLTNSFNHRFIFRTQATDGSFNDSQLNQSYLSDSQSIYEISCYGQNCWVSANKMMEIDRAYYINNDNQVVFNYNMYISGTIYATQDITAANHIYTHGSVYAKGGFIFSGQADLDKKLLRADGWWQSVSDFATPAMITEVVDESVGTLHEWIKDNYSDTQHTHTTINNDLIINGTATATELILTPNSFINTATISVIADAPDMTTIDIGTNTQISGQLTADSANITNTLSASTILVGDIPVITGNDLRFKLLVPNQNTQSYAISTTLLLPLHEIIILISNNSSSSTTNIKILQNDSTEIFSNNIAAGKVMRISGYRIGDSGLLFYGDNQISSLTNCASGIYKINSTAPVTLTIIGR